jgi:transposase-like protein
MPLKKGRPRTGVTLEMVQKELTENKLTVTQIAEKFGVSRDTIERRLKQGAQESKSKKSAAKPTKESESAKPSKTVTERESKIHLLSQAVGDSKVERYVYNEKTDTYITFLHNAPEPLVIAGQMHRDMAKAYSNWDGVPASINEMCRTFSFPRPWFAEYKTVHGWTHDKEPFSAEELMARPVEELADTALQMKRQALHQKFEIRKWQETQEDADKWRDFDHNVLRPLAETIAEHAPHYSVPLLSFPRVLPVERFALLMSPTDLHYGKQGAWSDDAGQTYTKPEVDELLMEHATRIVNQVMRHGRPEVIFIPVGSDWFHVDNLMNTTTAGTPQDVDRLPENIFFQGKMLAVKFIDMMRQLAPVCLIPCKGNHDEQNSLSLLHFLHAWYRQTDDVEVRISDHPRQYVQYGNSLIGTAHGNDERVSQLPGLMSNEAKEAWGATEFRYFFSGHLHHETSRELDGIQHFQLPSLASADRWHVKKGFNNSRRAIHAHKITYDRGIDGIFISSVIDKSPSRSLTFGFKLKTAA